MIALPILVNSVDQSITVDLRDVNGSPMTGKAYNTSGFTCYFRQGATGAMTQLTLATQTVTGAHSDGGFVELDDTNAPGSYRLDLSDTMVDALGITEVFLNGIAGMDPLRVQVPIVAYNPQDAVRMGMTALPNAAASALGGLITSPDVANIGKADIRYLNGVAAAAVKLAVAAGVMRTGTVESAGHTPTTTEFEASDITEATADHYNGRSILFTSGALTEQQCTISDYSLVSGRGHFTVSTLTEAPADNDTFIIV